MEQGENVSQWTITPHTSAQNPSWILTLPEGSPIIGTGTKAFVEFKISNINTHFQPGPTIRKYVTTPPLQNRFIVAAGGDYHAGSSGNYDTHTHTIDIPAQSFTTSEDGSHTHKFPSHWYDRLVGKGAVQ